MREHVLPAALVRAGGDRRAHDAEVGRLPIGADDEVVAKLLHLVFQIRLARQYGFEAQLRIVGIGVTPLGLLGALHGDEQVLIGPALAHAHVVAVIVLLVNQRILCGVSAELVLVDSNGQQGHRILGDV